MNLPLGLVFRHDNSESRMRVEVREADLLNQILDTIIHSVNDPSMSFASIQNEIEKLAPDERVSLIDLLWDSLDGQRIKEIEAKWAAESEDRIDAFECGELAAVEGPTALQELRKSLTK
jgi:putative addiction module component (TIGR02574 family)